MSDTSMIVAGIDTGKAKLHVCLLPTGERFSVDNNKAGTAKLAARCVAAGVVRAGIEATSIYHRGALQALREAGIETTELQPRQARGLAVALLRRAKNDTIDASIIARLVQVLNGPWKQPPPAHLEALAEVLTYIDMLDDRLVVLKTQRERFTSKRLLDRFDKEIKALEKRQRSELRSLVARLRNDQAMSDNFDLLMSIPTIGERTAAAMLIRMPELGNMTREQAASLLGVAPFDDKSAERDGQRHIAGGRARLRKTVYMAAFSHCFATGEGETWEESSLHSPISCAIALPRHSRQHLLTLAAEFQFNPICLAYMGRHVRSEISPLRTSLLARVLAEIPCCSLLFRCKSAVEFRCIRHQKQGFR